MEPNRAVTVIYSRAILVAVTSECRVKMVMCKIWIGTLTNSADPDQTPQNVLRHLISVYTVCLNNRELSVKWSSFKFPLRTIFPAYTQRQSTNKCCQCFDYFIRYISNSLILIKTSDKWPKKEFTQQNRTVRIKGNGYSFRGGNFLKQFYPHPLPFWKRGKERLCSPLGVNSFF